MQTLIKSENNASAIQPSLILIPDISGFTEYMNTSENMHCRYIIADLIELILDNDILGLSVSEIEGDAVLFYRYGKQPPLGKIIEQCEVMFIKFHSYLIQFENNKLCGCKCCSNAKNLSLKFVVHYGKVSPVIIKNHNKLFGSDIILSHKLLKNNIDKNQYILLTDTYLNAQSDGDKTKYDNDKALTGGSIKYEHIGTVQFYTYDLSFLKQKITYNHPMLPRLKEKNPITYSIYINAPPVFVKDIITDFKFKPNWITILNNISYDEKTIPQICAKHRCIMNDIFLKPVVIDYESIYLSSDNKTYVEKLKSKFIGLDAVLYFEMINKGLGTLLKLELHLIHTDFYSRFIKILFKRKSSQRRIKYSLIKLKSLCESVYNKYL